VSQFGVLAIRIDSTNNLSAGQFSHGVRADSHSPVACFPPLGCLLQTACIRLGLSVMKNQYRRLRGVISAWQIRFQLYVERCLTSGYIPRRYRPLQIFAKYVSYLWAYVQVGRITIVGRQNLTACGRLIFCPNHSSMFDAVVMYAIMKKSARYMTAVEEMRGLGGLKAVAMGAFGCFAVDRKVGHTVLEPAIEVLLNDEPLVLFPHGKISKPGEFQRVKSGFARIGIIAHVRLAGRDRVGIVPIHICYGRRDEATAGGSYLAMGFKWRGGVTVTAGEPIYIDEVAPLTPDTLTERVRQVIESPSCPTTTRHRVLAVRN
jgi:1-acyl-sn-glycerol-3-phosphate acyltransferase